MVSRKTMRRHECSRGRTDRIGWVSATCLALIVALAPAASAQETRTEQLEQQRAERARQVQPEPRTKVEKALLYLDQRRLPQRIFSPEAGFYPQIGSVTTGGGFALGAGY